MTDKPTPNKENIQKWVDALRSGKYTQAIGTLMLVPEDGGIKDASYCCLGVACIAAGLEPVMHRSEPDPVYGDVTTRTWWQFDEEEAVLPHRVREWLGLNTVAPSVTYDGWPSSLTNLNDVARLDFNQIADVIEDMYLSD